MKQTALEKATLDRKFKLKQDSLFFIHISLFCDLEELVLDGAKCWKRLMMKLVVGHQSRQIQFGRK